ncbi:MAG: formyltransferase family protein, partial [Acidimicrobiia bacterium]
PILAQEAVPVLPDDTVETLHERIKEVERRLYPEVLRQLMAERAEPAEVKVGAERRGRSSRRSGSGAQG